MKKFTTKFDTIFMKLFALITVITIFTGMLVGGTSYFIAKKQLTEVGKDQLKQTVESAIVTLEVLNSQVEANVLTLDEAKEQARVLLSGPKLEEGYDFSKSKFLYKEKGYLVGYDSQYGTQLHPVNEIGSIPEDTSRRESMVTGAKSNEAQLHYVEYMDTDDFTGEYKKKIAYMQEFEAWDWYIGMVVFEDEFYSELTITKWIITLITAVIILVSILIFYFASRKKITMLKNATNASLQVSSGDLKEINLPSGKDEIGQLGNAFNRMITQIRQLVSGIRESSSNLLDSSNELSAISEQTTASSEEIGKAITDISLGISSQSDELTAINENVRILDQSILNITEKNNEMINLSNETSAASEIGKEIVNELKQSNEKSSLSSEQALEGISNLANKINNISIVTDTIRSISSETNLLALNASIEAARAGESGKGFAVVASEVRKLADQSGVATDQIQEMLQDIILESEKTVSLITETNIFSKALNQSVHETEKQFNVISNVIYKILESNQELHNAIEQINVLSNNITNAIQTTNDVANHNVAFVEEINSSVEEQITALLNITRAAEELNELSIKLDSIINEYTL